MSPESGPTEVITGVVDSLRQSRELLLDPSPRNVDCCRVAIAQCIQKVAGLMEGDRSRWNKHELRPPLLQIRGELGALSNLLNSAAAFRRGMLTAVSAAERPRAISADAGDVQTVPHVHLLG